MTTSKRSIVCMFWVTVLTAFSVVVHPGYDVYHSDQLIYYPAIVKKLDPSLFQNDLLLQFNQSQYTFFDELMVFVIQQTDVNLIVSSLALFVFVKILFFLTMYYLAYYFSKSHSFSFFILLVYVTGSWIYGTTAVSVGTYLSPRMIGVVLGLMFLLLYCYRWRISASVILALTVMVHPISAIPFLAFFYLDLIVGSYRGSLTSQWISLASGMIPFFGLFVLMSGGGESGLEFFSILDPELGTLSFLYLSNWGMTSLAQLLVEAVLCGICFRELRGGFELRETDRIFRLILIVPLVVGIANFLFSDLINWQIFVQVQPYRSFVLWKLFLPLFLGLYIYKKWDFVVSNNWRALVHFGLIFSYFVSFSYRSFPVFVFGPLVIYQWLVNYGFRERLTRWQSDSMAGRIIQAIIFLSATTTVGSYVYIKRGQLAVTILISVILFGFLAGWVIRQRNRQIVQRLAGLITVALCILVAVNAPAWSYRPDYHTERGFSDTCRWLKQRTDVDDVILANPFTRDGAKLRLSCRRNVFYSRKGTAQMLFNVEFAREWRDRQKWVGRLSDNPAAINQMTTEYSVEYVVSERALYIDYPEVFQSGKYRIYALKDTN